MFDVDATVSLRGGDDDDDAVSPRRRERNIFTKSFDGIERGDKSTDAIIVPPSSSLSQT